MHLNLELLSRIQFAFTISFHILYPAFSIGLITFIAFFELLWLNTRNPHYLNICKFWTKILALTFGMGIVSGIVMEFQLGTNWSNYTQMSGNVLGVLFTYEVLTAFFIEAGFLGIMFFGWNRVSPQLHFAATLLALFGVTLSAFWIMSANSWMQFPTGVEFKNAIFTVNSWFDTIFNPLFLPRFFHMLIATYISTLLVIIAICAYYLLKGKNLAFAKTCFSAAFIALVLFIPLQIVLGDLVGIRVHHYQPIKTAAMEGAWETQRGAPLLLFAVPDQQREMNHYALGIPKLASYINTHQWDGELRGLKSVPPADRPYVALVFYSFRVMVGLWVMMLAMVVTGVVLYFRKRLFKSRWYLYACILLSPIGFISIITGWFTAEFGRQPWVIYGYLRTAAAHSQIQAYNVIISLISIIIVYGIIFGYFYFRYFFKIIRTGLEDKLASPEQTFSYLLPKSGGAEGDKKR
jgi:cytochrome d ubiquinol oxidase subunit I